MNKLNNVNKLSFHVKNLTENYEIFKDNNTWQKSHFNLSLKLPVAPSYSKPVLLNVWRDFASLVEYREQSCNQSVHQETESLKHTV